MKKFVALGVFGFLVVVVLAAYLRPEAESEQTVSESDLPVQLKTGQYSSVEDAEKAVGFAIPHPQDIGDLKLESVQVAGGVSDEIAKVLGGTARRPPPEPQVGDYGRGPEWAIVLYYRGTSPARMVTVSFWPVPSIESGSTQDLEVREIEISGKKGTLYRPLGSAPSGYFVSAIWTNGFTFRAVTRPELRASEPVPGLEQEFLTFISSIR